MSDLIRREDAIKCLDGNILITGRNEAEAVKEYFEMVVNRLEAIPSAEPKVGRWEETVDEWCGLGATCSACNKYTCVAVSYDIRGIRHSMNYCPNCGAKMERSE